MLFPAIGGSCPNKESVCFSQKWTTGSFTFIILSEEVTQSVLAFYEDDEYTRLMPGKRDCVSLGKMEYRQKRLLLR